MVKGFIPVRPIQSLDSFGIQVLYSLLVASAHAVLSSGIAVESIDSLSDAHLRCSHC